VADKISCMSSALLCACVVWCRRDLLSCMSRHFSYCMSGKTFSESTQSTAWLLVANKWIMSIVQCWLTVGWSNPLQERLLSEHGRCFIHAYTASHLWLKCDVCDGICLYLNLSCVYSLDNIFQLLTMWAGKFDQLCYSALGKITSCLTIPPSTKGPRMHSSWR